MCEIICDEKQLNISKYLHRVILYTISCEPGLHKPRKLAGLGRMVASSGLPHASRPSGGVHGAWPGLVGRVPCRSRPRAPDNLSSSSFRTTNRTELLYIQQNFVAFSLFRVEISIWRRIPSFVMECLPFSKQSTLKHCYPSSCLPRRPLPSPLLPFSGSCM